MFCRWEGGSVGSAKVFIHLRRNGDFLFLLHNLAAGCWWDTPKAVLDLFTFPGAMICCIRQNEFDLGYLLLKFCVRADFFWLLCHRSRFVARESNRICSDVPSGLLSCFTTAGWDLEINSFRKGYLSVLLDRVKMRDQVGYVWVEYWKNNLRVVTDPENICAKDGRILVWKGSRNVL